MAKKKVLRRTATRAFVRNIGWKQTTGGYSQHKFHLGSDDSKAEMANLRLEQLWTQVTKRWERENPNELYPTDRPVWDAVTLAVAEAVRKAQPVAKVPLPDLYSALVPESPLVGAWVDQLQTDITVVKIEVLDPVVEKAADEYLQKQGQRLVETGRKMLHKKAGGETLHSALTVYGKWIASKYLNLEKKITPWGSTQGRHVVFLRKHLPESPLAALDANRVDELLEVLRMRPNGEDDKPVSVAWTRNVIKQFRHFLRWLNRTQDFAWKRPVDLETSQVRIPLQKHEIGRSARAAQVETYSTDELKLLWQYASPFQRLLMLLALNCGFGKAEVSSLELSEVLLKRKHPRVREVDYTSSDDDSWVMRVRHKSGVYGEWKLWPETVRAVEWWLKQREAIPVTSTVTALLVTSKGHRLDMPTKGNHPNMKIPNGWFHLTKRVIADHPTFRSLSYNKLRKTAGNLIREKAGGEIAGVFLCHGTPVRADIQLDLYSNRPFAKVFSAIESVGNDLRTLWGGVNDPFPDTPPKKGGPNISLGKIRQIQTMKKHGYKTSYVAEKLGVSVETVRRWAKPAPKRLSS